jgi:hypothetical protein
MFDCLYYVAFIYLRVVVEVYCSNRRGGGCDGLRRFHFTCSINFYKSALPNMAKSSALLANAALGLLYLSIV